MSPDLVALLWPWRTHIAVSLGLLFYVAALVVFPRAGVSTVALWGRLIRSTFNVDHL